MRMMKMFLDRTNLHDDPRYRESVDRRPRGEKKTLKKEIGLAGGTSQTVSMYRPRNPNEIFITAASTDDETNWVEVDGMH